MRPAPGALIAAVAALAGLVIGCRDTAPEPPRPTPPPGPRRNVLVLVMDTARADRLSLHGYERKTSPQLEELARDSTVFENAWGPAGWTGPSHATLFTGLRPHGHGFLEGNRDFLAPDAVTLAETLAAAGWKTAAFTNNEVVSPEYGLTQGFDRVEAYYGKPRRSNPAARATHEDALAWARETHAAGHPFFLFINDIEPHLPYDPPDEIVRPWLAAGVRPDDLRFAREFNNPKSDGFNMGMLALEPTILTLLSDLYDGDLASLDAEIGRLVGGLREARLLDSTLLVITSDHGENLGDHGLLDHKWSLHRSILHLPLLLRLPGRFDGGRRVKDVVRLEDVFPTVLDALGFALPAGLDGAPLDRDVGPRLVRSSWGTWMHFLGSIKQSYPEVDATRLGLSIESVFDGRWHYIHRADGADELYDVAADPKELIDRSDAEAGEVARLKKLLEPQMPPIAVSGGTPSR